MNKYSGIVSVKTAALLGLCIAGAAFGFVGCQNTAEGAKQDTANNTATAGDAAKTAGDKMGDATQNAGDKMGAAAQNAGDKMGNAAHNAGAALSESTVTPKVKTAIIANATLNDSKNLINVDTKDGTVYLKGHVQSNDQKKLAGEIAAKTVKENGTNEKIMNQLTVASH